MTLLRIIDALIWFVVAVYMAPAVLSIFRGKPRTGDPARLACFSYGIVSAGFSLRWLVAPDSTEIWAALYAMSALVAVYTLHAARSYGRGDHV